MVNLNFGIFLLEGNFQLRHLLNDWALKVNIENFKIVLILSSHKEHHKPSHILKEEKTKENTKADEIVQHILA